MRDKANERTAPRSRSGGETPAPVEAPAQAESTDPPAAGPGSSVPPAQGAAAGTHWLNVNTGVRHNSGCKQFGATKGGRPCGADEGRACGICGG